MPDDSLAAALEGEHREIDQGVEQFSADPASSEAVLGLTAAISALRRHIYLEEEFLFPALAGDGGENPSGLVAPIFVMLREHGQMWHALDSLEYELTSGTDRTEAWNLCHRLGVALRHHNMKEERILYPEADRSLSPSAAAELRAFLESGQLPHGWVSTKARS